MAFCENCGGKLKEKATFCEECGTKVKTASLPVSKQHVPVTNISSLLSGMSFPSEIWVSSSIGAVSAFISGIIISMIFYNFYINWVTEQISRDDIGQYIIPIIKSFLHDQTLKFSGYNYYTGHLTGQIIAGTGNLAGGNITINMNLFTPIFSSLFVPLVALIIGGYVLMEVIIRKRGDGEFYWGSALAVPYCIIMIIGRSFFVLNPGDLGRYFPSIPLVGQPSINASFEPDFWRTLICSFLLGGIGGYIGGVFRLYGVRWIYELEGRLIAFKNIWINASWGAIKALGTGNLIMGMLVFLGLISQKNKGLAIVLLIGILVYLVLKYSGFSNLKKNNYLELFCFFIFLIFPIYSMTLFYFSSGIGLNASLNSSNMISSQNTTESFSVSLLGGYPAGKDSGFDPDGVSNYKGFPVVVYLLFLLAGFSITSGGMTAVRMSDCKDTKETGEVIWRFVAVFTAILILMKILFLENSLSLNVTGSILGKSGNLLGTVVSFGPSFWGTLVIGVIMGSIFGGVGGMETFSYMSSTCSLIIGSIFGGVGGMETSHLPHKEYEMSRKAIPEKKKLLFCENCGGKLKANASFCEECGERVKSG